MEFCNQQVRSPFCFVSLLHEIPSLNCSATFVDTPFTVVCAERVR